MRARLLVPLANLLAAEPREPCQLSEFVRRTRYDDGWRSATHQSLSVTHAHQTLRRAGSDVEADRVVDRTWAEQRRRPLYRDLALRTHDLRHTCASLLIQLGAHPKAIQDRLGHSDIGVTLNLYGHLFPSLEAHLTNALEDLRRSATGS